MRNRITVLLATVWVASHWLCGASIPPQTNLAEAGQNLRVLPLRFKTSHVKQTNLAEAGGQVLTNDEKEACIRNLKIIHEAIQRYRADHKDIPNWLSDLVPQYIDDANVLICPTCKRTGETEPAPLADPKMPCSYLYEFCPVPLGKNDLPDGPARTRREWKRRQMGLVGSVVPIVRCRHHAVVLNLAFDGRIYESPPFWEHLLTNHVDAADLSARRIFAGDSTGSDTAASGSKVAFLPRDPQTKPGLIDLSAFFNAALTQSWHGNSNNDLSSLPTGVQNFGGVEYDVRGIIQLSCTEQASKHFPARVNGIKIQQTCARLHFLHSAGFGHVADEDQQVGSYILHFAANHMQLEIPIIYGHDVRDWHAQPGEKPSADLKVAWTGTNGISSNIRLFTTTWSNVAPGVEIESIDFVSAMGAAAPFLIAITAE
jgi:hypothetical protein